MKYRCILKNNPTANPLIIMSSSEYFVVVTTALKKTQ